MKSMCVISGYLACMSNRQVNVISSVHASVCSCFDFWWFFFFSSPSKQLAQLSIRSYPQDDLHGELRRQISVDQPLYFLFSYQSLLKISLYHFDRPILKVAQSLSSLPKVGLEAVPMLVLLYTGSS